MRLLFIIIVLNITSLSAQRKHTKTIDDFVLKNGVTETEDKSYSLELYSSFNNEPVEQHKLEKIIIKLFNSSGFLTNESIITDPVKNIKYQEKYDFNEENQLTRYNFISNRSNEKTENTYNENHQIITQNIFSSGELEYKFVFHYADKKLVKLKHIYVKKNENISEQTYEYNNLDSLVSSENVHKNGQRIITNFTYENKKKICSELHFNKDILKLKIVTTYNERGVKLKEFKQNLTKEGISVFEFTKEFNADGLETRVTKRSQEEENLIKKKYDEFQNLIEEVEFNENNDEKGKELFLYHYDKNDNWIIKCHKRLYMRMGIKPLVVTKRLIKYDNGEYSKNISKHEALCFCVPDYKIRLKEFLIKEKKSTKIFIKDIEEQE